MNGPSIGRTPGLALRVYLAGEADHGWRRQVIQPHQRVAFDGAAFTERVLPAALPFQHDYVGPYSASTRARFVPQPPVYARAGTPPVPAAVRQIGRADVVFAWLGADALIGDAAFEIGIAHELGIPYVCAASQWSAFDRMPLLAELAYKTHLAPDPLTAYTAAMTDLDVTLKRPGIVTSRYDGKCLSCYNTYLAGHQIYWNRFLGGYHVDCFLLAQDQVHATTFNSILVNTLRTENGRLEKECLELMAKNSEIQKPR